MVEVLFWTCAAFLAYTYIFYPLLLVVASALIGLDRQVGPASLTVSILMPAHNEERNLEHRLDELTRQIIVAGISAEIIVISDGSTDRTVEVARQFVERDVGVLELPDKQGKAAALNAGAATATGDLLIFADARQRWADDALQRLIENFADPAVGAVSGDLVLESAPGVLAGVSLYWRIEKWLRKLESRLGSQVGVTGAISAVRRPLFRLIPPGTVLDDVYWPMLVVLQGYRVVHDERARAFDQLPANPSDEFRRKVRTLAGNFQLLTLLPASAFWPWSNRVWWQAISHKLMRLVSPWALLGVWISSFFLTQPGYTIFFYVAWTACLLAVLGLIRPLAEHVRPLGWAASFLVLNAAAWLAFWVWITGQTGKSWHKVQYDDVTPTEV
jgi:cellulose synthase/poly-beta-1,6-N-acetylglucosamine synthase-like glycosyltransferase